MDIGQAKLLAAGECGMVVEFASEISPAVNALVHQLTKLLKEKDINGILEIVPTYRSATIYFDPLILDRQTLTEQLLGILAAMNSPQDDAGKARVVHVPVCYGGVLGPELGIVAKYAGLSAKEVISIHTAKPYLVYMLGFIPGFPYLGGLSSKLYIPRLEKPRAKVPAGSVGIGGNQTGFYPMESQGEWWLIGRTPLRAFDPAHTEPFIAGAGDYIQFFGIDLDEYFRIRRAVAEGAYVPEVSFIQRRESR